jgi:hypothetical protein
MNHTDVLKKLRCDRLLIHMTVYALKAWVENSRQVRTGAAQLFVLVLSLSLCYSDLNVKLPSLYM